MLRTPFLVEQGKSPPLFRSIEEDAVPNQVRWGSISSTLPVLSGPEQVRVYHDWIGPLAINLYHELCDEQDTDIFQLLDGPII